MILIKKVILTILLLFPLSLCANSSIDSNFGVNMDNSKLLHQFLEMKAKRLDYPYSFDVYKKHNSYNVIIKSQNQEFIKKIPQANVDNFFEQHDKNDEKIILDIIFIPGKE